MSIRIDALKWYETKYGRIDSPIYTSKFYQPEESWPKKSVWWPQIPISELDEFSYINILCEVAPNKNNFHHLKISTKFLKDHIDSFHTLKNKITFYFSTDPKTLFIELRGKGSLDFSQFLVN